MRHLLESSGVEFLTGPINEAKDMELQQQLTFSQHWLLGAGIPLVKKKELRFTEEGPGEGAGQRSR